MPWTRTTSLSKLPQNTSFGFCVHGHFESLNDRRQLSHWTAPSKCSFGAYCIRWLSLLHSVVEALETTMFCVHGKNNYAGFGDLNQRSFLLNHIVRIIKACKRGFLEESFRKVFCTHFRKVFLKFCEVPFFSP